ncbi:MAG: iron chelate uptake ABC transporter family permease subunit, partial [Bacteroidales bacterium]|nr:iron chelate uptake ABC transporter family permease subunit [Bacteroidales bacterium]
MMKRLWLPLLLLLLMAADLFLGSVSLNAADVWAALWGDESSDIVYKIVWNFRFPKMVTALLAGMSLSVCGVQMQTLF